MVVNSQHRRMPVMMKRYRLQSVVALFCLAMTFCSGAIAVEDACRWEPPERARASTPQFSVESGGRDVYSGMLRVFVTEINGRWKDNDDIPFMNAFLAFAMKEYVFLNEIDTLQWTAQWNGNDFKDANGMSYGNLREENVKVIAAVYNSAGYPGYSNPPGGAQFMVHEVDAAAAATTGVTGYNLVTEGFTHTVFVEDGATTW